jgi:hypothetical protein
MPYIAYGDQPPMRQSTIDLITWADSVAIDYASRGLGLTLRQLYYQGVSANVFPNKESSYDRLITAVTRGRYAGLIDWSHLTDRNREAHGVGWEGARFPELSALVRRLSSSMVHDLWEGQECRPEVWVEKQALEEVAQRGAAGFRVPYLACKGYMSASEMWEAAYNRFGEYNALGQRPIIIHIGDHDPSGIDMTRDIQERLSLFSGMDVEVRRIALNMDQIDEFNPPPQPGKVTDSRFRDYAINYGNQSWELDALRPELLIDLIKDEVRSFIDVDEWEARREEETAEQERVREISDRWPDIEAWLDENPA